jgi:hypothetical protein
MASRINFKTILAKYNKVGKANVRLTQSTLVLSKPISATTTVYNFDVLESQTQTLLGDEIRLNLNDEFIITSLGFYIQARVLDGALNDTGAKVLLSYAPFEANSLQASRIANFWNGAFQIAVNNIIYLDKYDTRKSLFVPRTQFANFSALTGTPSTQPSVDFSKDAMYSAEPLLTLSGAKKNNLILTLPQAISAGTFTVTDNGGVNYSLVADRVVCLARGLNAQNGASFQS